VIQTDFGTDFQDSPFLLSLVGRIRFFHKDYPHTPWKFTGRPFPADWISGSHGGGLSMTR